MDSESANESGDRVGPRSRTVRDSGLGIADSESHTLNRLAAPRAGQKCPERGGPLQVLTPAN
eukprot:6664432-Alexandrium_andersonii.AAC.1